MLNRVHNPVFNSLWTIQQSAKVRLELPDYWIDVAAKAYQEHVKINLWPLLCIDWVSIYKLGHVIKMYEDFVMSRHVFPSTDNALV